MRGGPKRLHGQGIRDMPDGVQYCIEYSISCWLGELCGVCTTYDGLGCQLHGAVTCINKKSRTHLCGIPASLPRIEGDWEAVSLTVKHVPRQCNRPAARASING